VSDLTGTFQGQLFHRRLASTGSYGPTARRPPARPVGLRAHVPSPIPSTRLAAHVHVVLPVLGERSGPSWRAG